MATNTSATMLVGCFALKVYEPPPIKFALIANANKITDVWHGGTGVISGTINEAGTPDIAVRRRVRLHRKSDGMLVRETWSAADGSYAFTGLAIQLYYVVSHDHTGNYNAVVKDSITPEMS